MSAAVIKRGTWDEPKSRADSVRDSEARKVKAGGRRLPGGVLPADASEALAALLSSGYAMSATATIARALKEAAKRKGLV